MSQAVLISIRPKYCELIASGQKTGEVRKTAPKIPTPFKCYIYCTKDPGNKGSATHFFESDEGTFWSAGKTFAAFLSGTVIGEFVCDKMDRYIPAQTVNFLLTYLKAERGGLVYPIGISNTCLSEDEFVGYGRGKTLFGWHISELVIYDKPKKLSDFRLYNTSAVIEHGLPMPTHEIKRPPQSWCYVVEAVS